MTSRENIERWVAELDEYGMCNISDNQVAALIRGYKFMAVQLANAESKCRELAAENAGLKAMCEDRRTFIMNGVQLGYIQVPTVETDPALETIRVAVSPQEPTPATEDVMAEVRAQGVDSAIDHLNKIFDAKEDIGEPIRALEWLAQAIRKGAAL